MSQKSRVAEDEVSAGATHQNSQRSALPGRVMFDLFAPPLEGDGEYLQPHEMPVLSRLSPDHEIIDVPN